MDVSSFALPLAGGLLIGLSAGAYLLLNGRVAGISGIAAAAMGIAGGGVNRIGLGFLAGILAGAGFAATFLRAPEITVTSSPWLLVMGGLLVGYGTRLGSGCTSGHGVCGLARLSPRSLAATLNFMAVAAITVLLVRHAFGVGL